MLGEKIKILRKAKKMSLEDLAERVGTSRQTIHRYENGIITNIPPEKVESLARALGTTPSMLMGWNEEGKFSSFNNINIESGDGKILPISVRKLPILGEIACGKPIYAEREYESFATADSRISADFCLRACGDSMIGARIFDGDIVFIRSQSTVDNGEIAAVIINDEATLKRVYYYPDEGKLVLSAENPKYAPLVYVKDELNQINIIGKAVAFQSAIQ